MEKSCRFDELSEKENGLLLAVFPVVTKDNAGVSEQKVRTQTSVSTCAV